MASSSTKNLLEEYHRLAADTLLGDRSTNIDEAVLSAAEDGQYDRLELLISRKRAAVDAKDPMTGDTPLIIAARNGQQHIVELLLNHGADLTLQNDNGENALDAAPPGLRKYILGSIQHEDRAMSNAQAFLQSAWLGDAVSIKRYLSGNHYLDVNVHNKDGLTPLLLVTRDISLFDKVQNAMENEYNPVNVLQDLLDSHADVNRCDRHGRNALHLVASSESIHARKMVSLLLKNGSNIDSVDEETYSPLHVASRQGHTAIIVALVEEGGADVNVRGGEQGDTPLMLTARGGHNEAAKYLIAKGADVTAVDENGDTALTIANTPSMVRLLKEAWTEQTQTKIEAESETAAATTDHESMTEDEITKTPRSSVSSDTDDLIARSALISPLSPEQPDKNSFFLTQKSRKLSRSLADFEESDLTEHETLRPMKVPAKSVPFLPLSEAEADDELDNDLGHRRTKPATRRAHIRANFEESLNKRKPGENQSPKHTTGTDSATKSRSLPRHMAAEIKDQVAYSSADEDYTRRGGGSKVGSRAARLRSRDEKKPHSGHRRVMEYNRDHNTSGSGSKSRPSRLALQHSVNDPSLSRSHDSLVGVAPTGVSKRDKKPQFLPDVVKSSAHTGFHRPRISPKQKTAPDKLPSLTDMQPVALVAVDTERDRLRVQQYNNSDASPRTKRNSMQRSKSLMSVTSHTGKEGGVSPSSEGPPANFNPKKRNSTGSLVMQRAESKVPFLPNVITPQLGLMIQGVGHKPGGHAHHPVKGRGRLQPLVVSLTPTSPIAKMLPTLSNINEDNESGSFDKTLTKSFHDLGSKDSTLKDESRSDFETDSLERHGVIIGGDMSVGTMIPSHTHSHSPSGPGGGAVPVIGYVQMLPSPHHHQQQQLHGGPHQLPSQSNLVVNYAVQDGSLPLSPIWNQMQFLRTDSETSSNSEYITSYIGRLTPLPHVQAPDPASRKFGADSGHGESSDEDRDGESSDGSGSEGEELQEQDQQEDNCLKWKRGRLLGKGAYGKVWEGLMNSAKMIAVKEVELDNESAERAQSQYEKIQVEVEILRSLRHKNIVSYLGTSMQQSTVYIFMEYISGGSLQSILKRFGPLDCRTIAHYTRQITRALNYLHSNAIIHRDIKGANIMVTSRGVVKLIDFGCAKKYYQELSAGFHSVRGTPYWMAPEVIRGDGYGRKSDIWSLGCTVHEMATTKPPWADYPPEAALFQIGSGKAIPELPDHLPHRLKNFVDQCLIKDQNQRPSANMLLEQEFLLVYK